MILPLELGHGERDGQFALDFLGLVVERGAAIVDPAEPLPPADHAFYIVQSEYYTTSTEPGLVETDRAVYVADLHLASGPTGVRRLPRLNEDPRVRAALEADCAQSIFGNESTSPSA